MPELGHLQVEGSGDLSQAASPEAIARAVKALGAASLAFTYNDPVPFIEDALDCADAAHELGVRAIAVTAGYICPGPRAEMYAHIDAANVDLKAFTEDFYKHVCGGHLGAVLDTLEYLHHETSVWLEVTNLLIPGLNGSDAEVDALTSWVVGHLGPDVPMHFSAFHPDFKMMDRPPTPPETLSRARHIALANGAHHALYRQYRLTGDGHCEACGTRCPGVYAGPAGTWGSRRLPVRIPGVAHR